MTLNNKDFPPATLAQFGIERLSPDQFVLDQLDLAPAVVLQTVMEQVQALRSPPKTLSELLDTLHRNGLVRSVAKLRELGAK